MTTHVNRLLALLLVSAGPLLGAQAGCPPSTDADLDADGYTAESGDCDDTNPNINPGAEELCDGLDNDCDGRVDDGCTTPTPTAPVFDTVAVTFRVDTNTMADGSNPLASVSRDQQIFLTGDFMPGGVNCWDVEAPEGYPCWDPQHPRMAMDPQGDGIYAVTLNLIPGTTIEYKFTKTASNPQEPWDNVMKDFAPTDERRCAPYPDAEGGLWEVPNLSLTVLDEPATLRAYPVEAWRTWAEGFGYPSCD